jgi:hypothetical protein
MTKLMVLAFLATTMVSALKDSFAGKIHSMTWEIPVANEWMSCYIYMKYCYENSLCVWKASARWSANHESM